MYVIRSNAVTSELGSAGHSFEPVRNSCMYNYYSSFKMETPILSSIEQRLTVSFSGNECRRNTGKVNVSIVEKRNKRNNDRDVFGIRKFEASKI